MGEWGPDVGGVPDGLCLKEEEGSLPGLESLIHEDAYKPPNRVPETPEELGSS